MSSTGLKLERFITCSVQILAEKIMGKKSRIMCKLDNMNEKKSMALYSLCIGQFCHMTPGHTENLPGQVLNSYK